MRDHRKCHCHICRVERSLLISLHEPKGMGRFSRLAVTSSIMEGFPSSSPTRSQTGEVRRREEGCNTVGECDVLII